MFPFLLIAIGIAVLALGKRLAVMGAAVGFLLGVGLLALFPGTSSPWITFGLPIVLAVVGFFCAGLAKGVIAIVILVIGALAGAAIVLAFLDLFNVDAGLLRWVLAAVGGVVGFVLIRRFRKGSKDWGMLILAGLVGALLVMRGLGILLPSMQGSISTLIVIVLAGASIAFQGGYLGRRKAAVAAPASTQGGSQTAAEIPSAPASAAPAPTQGGSEPAAETQSAPASATPTSTPGGSQPAANSQSTPTSIEGTPPPPSQPS